MSKPPVVTHPSASFDEKASLGMKTDGTIATENSRKSAVSCDCSQKDSLCLLGFSYGMFVPGWPAETMAQIGLKPVTSSFVVMTTTRHRARHEPEGENAYAQVGKSSACSGDFDGDGFSDVIVGSACDSEAGYCAGAVFLIYGGKGKPAPSFDLSKADAKFLGEHGGNGDTEPNGDMVGSSVANVGDINGDGLDDLVVGAKNHNNEAGAVYIVYGRKKRLTGRLRILDVANAKIFGERPHDRAGKVITGVGDVNGDGYHDFLIGAPEASRDESQSGAAYLFYGVHSKLKGRFPVSRGIKLEGDTNVSFVGEAATGAGDLNGDKYAEFVVGSKKGAFLFYGSSTNVEQGMISARATVRFTGSTPELSEMGALSFAGDMNGDGFDDLLIGTPSLNETAGGVILIYGQEKKFKGTVEAEAFPRILGRAPGDQVGRALSPAGDLNKDSYQDFLLAGGKMVAVIYGGPNQMVGVTPVGDVGCSIGGIKLVIMPPPSELTISGGGDVNRDGHPDFLVGVEVLNSAYLFFGPVNKSD